MLSIVNTTLHCMHPNPTSAGGVFGPANQSKSLAFSNAQKATHGSPLNGPNPYSLAAVFGASQGRLSTPLQDQTQKVITLCLDARPNDTQKKIMFINEPSARELIPQESLSIFTKTLNNLSQENRNLFEQGEWNIDLGGKSSVITPKKQLNQYSHRENSALGIQQHLCTKEIITELIKNGFGYYDRDKRLYYFYAFALVQYGNGQPQIKLCDSIFDPRGWNCFHYFEYPLTLDSMPTDAPLKRCLPRGIPLVERTPTPLLEAFTGNPKYSLIPTLSSSLSLEDLMAAAEKSPLSQSRKSRTSASPATLPSKILPLASVGSLTNLQGEDPLDTSVKESSSQQLGTSPQQNSNDAKKTSGKDEKKVKEDAQPSPFGSPEQNRVNTGKALSLANAPAKPQL